MDATGRGLPRLDRHEVLDASSDDEILAPLDRAPLTLQVVADQLRSESGLRILEAVRDLSFYQSLIRALDRSRMRTEDVRF